MKVKNNLWLFKSRYCIEAGEGGTGGSGGGGAAGAPAAVESESARAGNEGAAGGNAGESNAAAGGNSESQGVSEADRTELTKLRNMFSQVKDHLDIDETTGTAKVKAPVFNPPQYEPTEEEAIEAKKTEDAANRAAQLAESNRIAEETIANEFKAKDPLFAKNFAKARERISKIPASQRTPEVWKRAYAMSQGESVADLEKHVRADERNKVLAEMARANNGAMPVSGASSAGHDGKVDISKIKLTSQQVAAAQQMIRNGLLSSIDEYKENLVYLGEVED